MGGLRRVGYEGNNPRFMPVWGVLNNWILWGRILGVLPNPASLSRPLTWIVVIGAIYGLWAFASDSDFYLRAIDPEQYWETKIAEYEQRLDTEQKLIRESRIHIEMLKAMEPFVIQKAMIWFDASSKIEKEAAYIRQSIAHEHDSIEDSESAVSEYRNKLIAAKETLARH